MGRPKKPLSKKKQKGLHRWKGFPLDSKIMEKMEKKVKEFEDATTKLRMEIAKNYNVKYHCCYFTRVLPDARTGKT